MGVALVIRSRELGHSAAVRGASPSIPPGRCPARPYLPGSPCACTRRLQAHRARRRRRREPERKERQRVSNRGGEDGRGQGAGARAGTLTRLGVKFPHAGGAAGGGVPKPCARSAGPAARRASPRSPPPGETPSRAEPEAAPGRALAAVAAARLTPGRAEPPARRRGPHLPARPLAGRGASKARRAAEGAGGGRAGGGRGAGLRGRAGPGAAGRTQRPPPGCGLQPRAGSWRAVGAGGPGGEGARRSGPGTREARTRDRSRGRASGQQAYWDRHPLGSCLLQNHRSTNSTAPSLRSIFPGGEQGRTRRLQFTGAETEVGKGDAAGALRVCCEPASRPLPSLPTT